MTEKNKVAAADRDAAQAPKTSRPTLFNLLEVLANYSMTTPSQRQCIRDIVTEFLANKFEHSKVYSYIGAVVGHDRLHAVIKQLEADPDRSPLPDQDGLMKIESAFNLTRNYKNLNANGDTNSTNKDEILRSIRRNLSKKCDLTRSSSVRTASAGVLLQKACWLPIRRALTAGPLYGHSLICIGNRAYILGGSNGRNQGFNLSKAHVINLLDFSSKQIMLSGEVPSHREGNSCNVAVLNQTHAVVLFGGFNGETFFNDLYLLDLEKRRWTRKTPTGPLPTPRDEHSALIYPPRCDLKTNVPPPNVNTAAKETAAAGLAAVSSAPVYLFVFGGKTGLRNQFQCLNDVWAYNLHSNYWTLVETGESKPCPRFGVCALWADDETVCVFGGETSSPTGYVDRTERVLLDDLWMFHLTSFNANKEGGEGERKEADLSPSAGTDKISGMWLQDYYEGNIGPRSHYSSIFIAQRCKELNTGTPRTIERLMFLTGGLTYAPGNKKVVVASDKLYFYFFSQKRWYSLKPNYPRNYIGEPFEPRQLHVACFFEKKNILFPGTKPSVPCIFFHGGFHKKQILSDSWVLSLTGEDLFFKNSLLSPETSNASNKMEMRMYPPWYYRESHSPSLLWGISTMQKWVFGALAHLVDNALKESVSSSNLNIKFESSPRGEELMLSVQDDGNGLDYNSMNRLLKLFGRSYSSFNATEDQETGSNNDEYGLGFKMAYGRLGNSVAVMSRTHDSIGIGMLSLELMCQCESREMAAPMCMWKLPSKELINRDGPCLIDQRHHQRLLMSYSPFNSASLLAEQINVLGVNPGTRLLFWQLRDDLDTLVLEDGTLVDSNTSHNTHAHVSDRGNDSDHEEVGNVVYMREHVMEGGIVMSSMEHQNKTKKEEKVEEKDEKLEPPGKKAVEAEPPLAKEMRVLSEEERSQRDEELKNLVGYHGDWYQVFPLWKSSKHSMDYCLPVYLYWLHLHSSCSLTVQDVLLKPNPVHAYLFVDKKQQPLEESDSEAQNAKRQREFFSPDTEVEGADRSAEPEAKRADVSHEFKEPADPSAGANAPAADASAAASAAEPAPAPDSKMEVDMPAAVAAAAAANAAAPPNRPVTRSGSNSPKTHSPKSELEAERESWREKKGLKLLGTGLASASTSRDSTQKAGSPKPLHSSSRSLSAGAKEAFLDLHSHLLGTHDVNSGFGMDTYSCGKNTCGYCGVSPIGRSLSGGETLYSFLKAKLFKSVQLPFLFHPEDHAQGCFLLVGFLNDPISTLYLSSSTSFAALERATTQTAASGSSNLGGLPSPTNRPLAPTSFVVTDQLPSPPSMPAQPPSATMSPTKGRKGKGQRGRPSAAAAASETKPEKTTVSTQVIYSGSMSTESFERPTTDAGSPVSDKNAKPGMFAGVGAGAKLNTMSSLSSTNSRSSLGSQAGFGFMAKQYSAAKAALEDRVCEAGVLLYYKGRLIKRLEGSFPAPQDELETARLPPKPSLFSGNLYRFALTAVVSVPGWLVPAITKQEFVHENNLVYLQFKSKLIKLLSEYCKVCLDEHTRRDWYNEKMKQILDYDLAHQKTMFTFMSSHKEEVEGLDDEVVPSWKTTNAEPFQGPAAESQSQAAEGMGASQPSASTANTNTAPSQASSVSANPETPVAAELEALNTLTAPVNG